jgi:predicted RNA-binding protein associated with RNAse of E/G family
MVEMRFTKWGGKLHWHYPVVPLGSDRHGWWLGGPEGTYFQRGDEEPILRPYDYVMLVPDEGDWIATWTAESETELYVDVTTRPVRRGSVIDAVDLDLDVIRKRDGQVVLVDEDEFAEHQVLYGYPAEVIARAQSTAGDLLARITAAEEPFGRAGHDWLARFVTGPLAPTTPTEQPHR